MFKHIPKFETQLPLIIKLGFKIATNDKEPRIQGFQYSNEGNGRRGHQRQKLPEHPRAPLYSQSHVKTTDTFQRHTSVQSGNGGVWDKELGGDWGCILILDRPEQPSFKKVFSIHLSPPWRQKNSTFFLFRTFWKNNFFSLEILGPFLILYVGRGKETCVVPALFKFITPITIPPRATQHWSAILASPVTDIWTKNSQAEKV